MALRSRWRRSGHAHALTCAPHSPQSATASERAPPLRSATAPQRPHPLRCGLGASERCAAIAPDIWILRSFAAAPELLCSEAPLGAPDWGGSRFCNERTEGTRSDPKTAPQATPKHHLRRGSTPKKRDPCVPGSVGSTCSGGAPVAVSTAPGAGGALLPRDHALRLLLLFSLRIAPVDLACWFLLPQDGAGPRGAAHPTRAPGPRRERNQQGPDAGNDEQRAALQVAGAIFNCRDGHFPPTLLGVALT